MPLRYPDIMKSEPMNTGIRMPRPSAGITADRLFFLDAVDNDGDALRFLHNNGFHFDVFFLQKNQALSVYYDILNAVREEQPVLEMDIRERQVAP